jgi:hypothetical protein
MRKEVSSCEIDLQGDGKWRQRTRFEVRRGALWADSLVESMPATERMNFIQH